MECNNDVVACKITDFALQIEDIMRWQSYEWRGGKMRRKGEILQGEVFSCSFCKGSGIIYGTKGIKCPVCKGGGIVRVQPPAILCAYCNGSGKVQKRTNITCTVCGGNGIVSVQEPIEVCSHCKGTGAEPNSKLPCLVCRGKGVV